MCRKFPLDSSEVMTWRYKHFAVGSSEKQKKGMSVLPYCNLDSSLLKGSIKGFPIVRGTSL